MKKINVFILIILFNHLLLGSTLEDCRKFYRQFSLTSDFSSNTNIGAIKSFNNLDILSLTAKTNETLRLTNEANKFNLTEKQKKLINDLKRDLIISENSIVHIFNGNYVGLEVFDDMRPSQVLLKGGMHTGMALKKFIMANKELKNFFDNNPDYIEQRENGVVILFIPDHFFSSTSLHYKVRTSHIDSNLPVSIKSLFPFNWNFENILKAIKQVYDSNQNTIKKAKEASISNDGKKTFKINGTFSSVRITVELMAANGFIYLVTAYPTY